LDSRPPFTTTRFLFVGQLGLLGGSPDTDDDPSSALEKTEKVETEKTEEPKSKKTEKPKSKKTGTSTSKATGTSRVPLQDTIVSTVALVEAFNGMAPTQTDALTTWAQAYIDWLNESTIDSAVEKSGAYLKEYALLAHVEINEDLQKEFRKAHFEAVMKKVLEDEVGRSPLMEALESCLKTLNEFVLHDESRLCSLVTELLSRLDPEKYPMTKSQLGLRRSTLYCCCYLLSFLKVLSLSSDALDPEKEESLYSQLVSRMEAITRTVKFYPYSFHVQLLNHLVRRLQAEKKVGVGGRAVKGMFGAGGLFKGTVALSRGDVKGFARNVGTAAAGKEVIGGIYSGYNAVRKRIGNAYDDEELSEWYELYITMNEMTEEILREQDTPEQLKDVLGSYSYSMEEVKQHLARGSLTPSKEAIALSYTLISLDGRIALESSNEELRKAALERLRDLVDSEKKPKGIRCLKEYGLCEVYLDLLATIACHGVEESERQFATETLSVALEVAEKTKTSLTSKIRGLGSSDSTSARENVIRWLQNEDLQTRLASVLPPPKHCKLGDLHGINLHRLSLTQATSSETVDGSLEEGHKAKKSDATKKTATKSEKKDDHKGDEEKGGKERSNDNSGVNEHEQGNGAKVEGTGNV